MKKLHVALILLISGSVFGQIEQNVNKGTGTESNEINDIDSIRFDPSQTQMQIILNNGSTILIHTIEDIENVTFDENSYSPGTVHCEYPTDIVDVIQPITGKIWMDRNLGAFRTAESSTDPASYGSLYQWGRESDGHQCVNRYPGDGVTSDTTSTPSSTDQPGHGDFILGQNQGDWRNPQNINLWQGINGVNNPCPSGYRLPTEAEWEDERISWSSNNPAGAYSSPLKLPLAGYRYSNDGSLNFVGSGGHYWSSTVDGTSSMKLNFLNTIVGPIVQTTDSSRANGYSVRCLKD